MRTYLCLLLTLLLLSPAVAPATTADAAYQQARLDFFALRKDDKRKAFRHHWADVLRRLDKAAGELKGERRCEALYNAGRAWHELSDISYLQDDRREAIGRYQRLVEVCPRSNLADDALFHTAELQQRRDPAAARRTLDRLVATYPKGDRVADARRLRAELPPAEEKGRATAAAPARNVAADRAAADRAAAERAAAERAAAERAAADRAAADRAAAERAAADRAAAERAAAERAAAQRAAVEQRAAAERTAAAASGAGAPTEPVAGGNLPSAVDILAALDAKGADAYRPADLALAEDLRRDKLATGRVPAEPPAAVPAAPPAPRAEKAEKAPLDPNRIAAIQQSTGGEIPLSLAAGLKVRRVVIDPGHGGKDTGAIGPKGTREKDIALAISRKLQRRLTEMGLEALLTRDKDVYLELEERTRFANENQADLFISIHVNAAANRKAYGIETYTLNLNSDKYAMRLAARENATSSRRIGDLQFILADLATKANTDDSVRLARLVQGEMVSRLRRTWGDKIKDLGVKQALFFVLVGAKMPAILVETAFVSNPEEEQRLRSEKYQEETARSIADGVRRFIDEREAIAQGKKPAGEGSSGVF